MHFAVHTALFLSLITSSLAYLVKYPSDKEGWYSHYDGPITWNRVNTDAGHFAIILTNQDRSVLPEDIVLQTWVSGGPPSQDHSIRIQPPLEGFPVGDHFRINFVKTASDQHTIYAQSSEFTVRA